MTKSKALSAVSVPLYLLPKTIAHQLRLFGDAVYRISVKRINHHHYNVIVRTKSVKRELRPAPVAAFEAVPVNSRGVKKRCGA